MSEKSREIEEEGSAIEKVGSEEFVKRVNDCTSAILVDSDAGTLIFVANTDGELENMKMGMLDAFLAAIALKAQTDGDWLINVVLERFPEIKTKSMN